MSDPMTSAELKIAIDNARKLADASDADLLLGAMVDRRPLDLVREQARAIVALASLLGDAANVLGDAARIGLRAALEKAPQRAPVAGEVLPPDHRASWARERTEHDAPTGGRFVPHPNCPSPSGRKV